jgi:diacylglycerol kinase family enzyme
MQSEYIHLAQTTKIKLTPDTPVPWTLDGEHGGDMKEVTVEVVKNAVKMFI